MKTLLLEITDYTAQTWWSRAFMLFITDILKTLMFIFQYLITTPLLRQNIQTFPSKKKVYSVGYTENFDFLLITQFRGNYLFVCEI
jgi:hypothetical protein